MDKLYNVNESNTYTLQSIDELYNNHHNINRIYHFQYKTEESAVNFGNLTLSLLDKDSHHTIHEVQSYYVSTNKKNLVMKSGDSKVGDHIIAYTHIPENYKFDIITSVLDGKTLVIYDKNIQTKELNKK
jgi:hypothetical protein